VISLRCPIPRSEVSVECWGQHHSELLPFHDAVEVLRNIESQGRVFEDLESPDVLLFEVELPLL